MSRRGAGRPPIQPAGRRRYGEERGQDGPATAGRMPALHSEER